MKLGFDELAAGTPTTASDAWPESLEAREVEVHWLGPDLVYGAYRYRVVIDGVESRGISERVFTKRDGRWEISVTTAFPSCSGKASATESAPKRD